YWFILLTHDRVYADDFHLTHELLSHTLGVGRSGISIAAKALQKRGLIHYVRGKIHVLDRGGLEAAACQCYAATSSNYKNLLS
ncbi:MAG: CRP-like cAMP-binding protein, partial [Cellvibrionaceae bacterium]